MKKVSFLKLLAVAFSLLIFSACSKKQYTFAPGTGGYHGEIKKTPLTADIKTSSEAPTFAATETAIAPIVNSAQTEASAALAKAFAANKQAAGAPETLTKTDKKADRQIVKNVKHQLKTLKKNIKDGKSDKGLGLNNNVKLLLILGLAFILVGALLGVHIIYVIGAILLIIGLVLLLMEIL